MNLPNLKAMQLKLLEAFMSHVKYMSSSPSFLVKSVQQVKKKKIKKSVNTKLMFTLWE